MAFKKLEEFNNTGLYGEYWRITNFSMDMETGTTRVLLSLYKDAETRGKQQNSIANKVCLFTEGFELPAMNAKNPVQKAYEKVKAEVDFFKDAEDC